MKLPAKKNNVIRNVVKMGLLLEFEVAFPGEQPLTLEEYLKGGNRSIILNVAAFFLGFKNQNSEYNDNKKLLGSIFGKENNPYANEIYSKIKEHEKKGPVFIINPYSSLKLFEYFFQREEEEQTQTDAEFERNLFKAYLLLNSEFTQKQKTAFTSTEPLDFDFRIPMMLFCMGYPVSDKTNYNINEIWVTQMVKAIYLFQFLENGKTQPLLTAYLKHFNCSSWEEYLRRLVPLASSAIKFEKEAHTDIHITPGEKFEEGCAFIEKLIVKDSDKLNDVDFLSLRAKPFYKVKEGVYRIIFNLFVVEKIFKGVYFLLREVNDKLQKGEKISDLKSLIGEEFSEQVLLYRILDIIMSEDEGYVKFSGKQSLDMGIDGAPDYYTRKGKNIMLFESKDFLIPAAAKESFDYNVYEEEFEKKLYFEHLNGKEKHKAVMQLINSIRNILRKEFPADTQYHYRDVSIYPILITHDHQYDTAGFNNLIDLWFQEELELLKEEGLYTQKVKPLVVINIDSLIYHQVGLSKKISLPELINKYLEHIYVNPHVRFRTAEERKEYRMSRVVPFSTFIDNYFVDKGWRQIPPILEIVAPALFKKELRATEQRTDPPQEKDTQPAN